MTSACLKLSIWNLQCKYSAAVEEYLNGLLLGIPCGTLDCLLNFKRALQMLSRNAVGSEATTVLYTADHSFVGTIVLEYLDENNEIQPLIIPQDITITFCAIEGSVTGTPMDLASVTLTITGNCTTHCDGNINDDTLDKVICQYNNKYK